MHIIHGTKSSEKLTFFTPATNVCFSENCAYVMSRRSHATIHCQLPKILRSQSEDPIAGKFVTVNFCQLAVSSPSKKNVSLTDEKF